MDPTLKKAIYKELLNFPNKAFLVLVNHKPINLGDHEKKRYVYVKYCTSFNTKKFIVGTFIRKPGYNKGTSKVELIYKEEAVEAIENALNCNTINGVSINPLSEDLGYAISLDSDLRILAICTKAFTSLKSFVSTVNNKFIQIKKPGTQEGLPVEVTSKLYDAMVEYSLEAYNTLISDVLLRKFKNNPLLKIYFLLNSYVVIGVSNAEGATTTDKVLFNPYDNIPSLRSLFANTKLYDNKRVLNVKPYTKYNIYLASNLNVCLGLGLKVYVPLSTEFFLDLLAGNNSEIFPSPTNMVYVYDNAERPLRADEKEIIGEKEYDALLDKTDGEFLEANYRYTNSLEYACEKYRRQAKLPRSLYDNMKGENLVWK